MICNPEEKIQNLNSLILGTEEYLATLIRRGESHRVSEVLNNQIHEIRKFVAETFIKIENVKQFMNHLEFKKRQIIIPQVNEILSKWDEIVSTLDVRLNQLVKKYN